MANPNPNVIPLKQAQQWAASWQEQNELKAFLIQKDNIDSILEAGGGVTNFRGYLGFDNEGKPALMIVGVDSNGNDLINEEKGFFVYDANYPCPANCDPESALFRP